jgi:hypothetical protein
MVEPMLGPLCSDSLRFTSKHRVQGGHIRLPGTDIRPLLGSSTP